jgi:hypothetical protein
MTTTLNTNRASLEDSLVSGTLAAFLVFRVIRDSKSAIALINPASGDFSIRAEPP